MPPSEKKRKTSAGVSKDETFENMKSRMANVLALEDVEEQQRAGFELLKSWFERNAGIFDKSSEVVSEKILSKSTTDKHRKDRIIQAELQARRNLESELNHKQSAYLVTQYTKLQSIDEARIKQMTLKMEEEEMSDKVIEAYRDESGYYNAMQQGINASQVGKLRYPKWESMVSEEALNAIRPYLLDTDKAKAILGHQDWLSEMNVHQRVTLKEPNTPVLNYNTHQSKVALEIIRRVKPWDYNKADYIHGRFPQLEFLAFPAISQESIDIRDLSKEYKKKGKPVTLKKALLTLHTWLVAQRGLIVAAVRLHYAVKQDNLAGNLLYVQECVNFYDRAFTYHVGLVTGTKFGGHVLKLGVTADLGGLARLGLEVGLPDGKGNLVHNEEVFKALNIPASAR